MNSFKQTFGVFVVILILSIVTSQINKQHIPDNTNRTVVVEQRGFTQTQLYRGDELIGVHTAYKKPYPEGNLIMIAGNKMKEGNFGGGNGGDIIITTGYGG